MDVKVTWDRSQISALSRAPLSAALRRVLGKAGSTARRDMRSEANKVVRALKAIKLSFIKRAITPSKDDGKGEWGVDVSGEPVPLVAYPHRQTKRGVSVEVNQGKRTVVAGSFVATMKSGHKGVFKRVGAARLPIRELLGSRPLDALMKEGEAQKVAARGGTSFLETFARLLLLEIEGK